MQTMKEAATAFLANKRIAVTGVSRTPKDHGANNVYKRHRHWTHSVLKNEPGTYFGRNIFATFEEDLVGIRTRDMIGIDALMWSCDYPHTDTSWPRCRENIDEHFVDVPDGDKRKVVGENSARVYGFDLN